MKIRLFISTLLILLSTTLSAREKEYYIYTSFHEPANEGLRLLYSEDGLTWDSLPGIWHAPDVGSQHIMRDPSIAQTPDGTFHFVWTCAWRGDRGFGYSSSHDLINWTPSRYIEAMPDTSTVNVWAPELFWDDIRQEMMVVWASCVPGKFPDGQEEHKNNQRLYYSTTKDFHQWSAPQLIIEPGFSSIDAMILKRGQGDYVMVLKDNTRPMRNLKVSFASDPHGPWSTPSEAFTEFLTEGPSVLQLADGSYVIYYDRYRDHDFPALLTTDFKSFEDITARTKIPTGHKHGTIFKVKKSVFKGIRKHLKSKGIEIAK